MKNIFLLSIFVFSFLLESKAADLQFSEKQVGNQKIIVCTNSSAKEYEVVFSFSSSGYKVNKNSPIKHLIKPYAVEEIVSFTPINGIVGNIQMNYTFKEIRKSRANESIAYNNNFKGITVFGKNYCGRCDFFINELKSKNIRFQELNIDTSKGDEDLMWDKLKAAGFNGHSVTTPVVVLDNKVYYNIKDLGLFLRRMKVKP